MVVIWLAADDCIGRAVIRRQHKNVRYVFGFYKKRISLVAWGLMRINKAIPWPDYCYVDNATSLLAYAYPVGDLERDGLLFS